jgi:hypothetical protein
MLDTMKKNYLALPLPTAAAEWVRKTDFNRTNNDRVEDLHLKLVNDPKRSAKYLDALRAVTDTEALEGSLAIDNADAARMIRDAATEAGDHVIAKLKLKAVVIHLNVVLKRYGMSRAERRQMIDGQHVPSENGQE